MTRRLFLLAALLIAPLSLSTPAEAGTRTGANFARAAKGTVVALETNHGTIHIQLFRKRAPKTVANFLRYVRKGHYNGTIFHRVMGNFMIQGGGFSAKMEKKSSPFP